MQRKAILFFLLNSFIFSAVQDIHGQNAPKAPQTKPALSTRSVLPEKYLKPEDAAKAFFTAMHDQNFDEAWESLSTVSQESFVKSYAGKSNASQARVREMFRKNDEEVRTHFWTPLRDRSKVVSFAPNAVYKLADQKGNEAMIEMSSGGMTFHLKTVKEGNLWRMAYVESNLE